MARCAACGNDLPANALACPACGEEVRVHIGSTANPVETELFEARLRSAGLPYLKQPHPGGGLLALLNGFSAPGADFFVPAANCADARRALGYAEDADAPAGPETASPRRGGWKTRVLGIGIVAVLLALYFGLDALLSFIRHLFGAP